MAVYKDKKRGTWYTSFPYVDWTGKKCRKLKRGFATKKEAQDWEANFLIIKASSTGMDKIDVSDKEEVKQEPPKQSVLAAKYNRLVAVDEELTKQNRAIFKKEQNLSDLEEELTELKGWFKGKQRSELEGKIADIQTQISNMKKHLAGIVRPYGYQNVKQFYAEFKASKNEYDAYQRAVSKWNSVATNRHERIRVADKLKAYQEQAKQLENSRDFTDTRQKDRGGR